MYCDTVVSSNPGFQESQFSFTVITIYFLWLKYPQYSEFHVRPLDGRDVSGEFGDKEPGILQGNGSGGKLVLIVMTNPVFKGILLEVK